MQSLDSNTIINQWCLQHYAYLQNEKPSWLNLDPESDYAEWFRLSGKLVPYFGWFWRGVDFTKPVTLGVDETPAGKQFAAFDESGKFETRLLPLTLEQTHMLRDQLLSIADNPSGEKLEKLFFTMQGFLHG